MEFFKSIRRFRRKIRPVGEKLEKGRGNDTKLHRKNLVIKAAIFFTLVVVTFLAYPRSELYQYNVEVGDYWRLESLKAPFDFAIYKDEGVIASDIRAIRHTTQPYFQEVPDAKARMAAKRDTVSNQLNRIFDVYKRYRENLARDSIAWAEQDSLNVLDLKRTALLRLTQQQWNYLISSYHEREFADSLRRAQLAREPRLDEVLLQEAWRRLHPNLQFYFTVHQRAHQRPGPQKNAHEVYVEFATGDDLDTSLQMELLDQLTTLLNNESAVPVVQQLMLAIVELDVPAATDELLSALNQRVTMHFRNPGQPLDAERAGLQRLFPKLISAASNNQPVTTSITRIAQASLRYVELVATQLDAGTVPAAQQEGYRQLVLLGDMILRWAQENMAGSRPAPAAIENAVRAGDWKFVRVQINQWKAVLREHPFNLANNDLSLSGE